MQALLNLSEKLGVALGSGGANKSACVGEEFACGGGRRDRGGVEAEPAEDGVCRGAASRVDEGSRDAKEAIGTRTRDSYYADFQLHQNALKVR